MAVRHPLILWESTCTAQSSCGFLPAASSRSDLLPRN
jgi:hypothetical protein